MAKYWKILRILLITLLVCSPFAYGQNVTIHGMDQSTGFFSLTKKEYSKSSVIQAPPLSKMLATEILLYPGQNLSLTRSNSISGCLDASHSIGSYNQDIITVSVSGSYDFWGAKWYISFTASSDAPAGSETSVKITYKWTSATGAHSSSETFHIVIADIPIESFWRLQTSGTENDLHGIFFISENTGWAVGDGGVIIQTQDGGATWKSQNAGLAKNLKDVVFVDNQTGYVAADDGVILKTVNAGKAWELKLAPTTRTLNALWFTSADTGWTVGGKGSIFSTVNGGGSWQSHNTGQDADLKDIVFVNNSKGWAVGESGGVYGTTDGGVTWNRHDLDTYDDFTAVHFVSKTMGWITGENSNIFVTIDGGNNWIQLAHGDIRFSSIFFTDDFSGWVIGENGYVFASENSGISWVNKGAGAISNLNQIYFPSRNYGYIAGDNGTIVKIVLPVDFYASPNYGDAPLQVQFTDYSIDGTSGFHWNFGDGATSQEKIPVHTYNDYGWFDITLTAQTPYGEVTRTKTGIISVGVQIQADFSADVQSGAPPLEVQFTNLSTGSITGYLWDFGDGETSSEKNPKHVYSEAGDFTVTLKVTGPLGDRTVTKQGYIQVKDQTWIQLDYKGVKLSNNIRPPAHVYFTSRSHGYILPDYSDTLQFTDDGGYTWDKLPLPEKGEWRMFWIDDLTGWIFSKNIYRTVDGGLSWTGQPFMENFEINDVHFFDAQNGWAACSDQKYSGRSGVFQTKDGGSTWTHKTGNPNFSDQCKKLEFIDSQHGWISGSSYGYLYKTSNGGSSWSTNKQFPVSCYSLEGLQFIDQSIGWACSSMDIYRTQDGGDNWEDLEIQDFGYINDMMFVSPNVGWIAGGLTNDSPEGTTPLIKTTDGGASWMTQLVNIEDMEQYLTINDIFVLDDSTGWAVGYYDGYENGFVLKLTNGYQPSSVNNVGQSPSARNAQTFSLNAVYPNPFNPSTTISFSLPKKSLVSLRIYDITGRLVEKLMDGEINSGRYQVVWNAQNLPSGCYFIQMKAGQYQAVQKCLLLK